MSTKAGVMETIVQEIMEKWSDPDGRILWAQAFAHRPDWRKALMWDDPAHREKAKIHVYRLRRGKGLAGLPASLLKPMLELVPPALVPRKGVYTDGLPYCPHCGTFVQPWNRAFNLSKNAGETEGGYPVE